MDSLECAQARIRAYIAESKVPEDPRHAENTLQWVLRLQPDADQALRLAALAHDIDRASEQKVRREAYSDYDDFKAAHARHGAEILWELLTECAVAEPVRREACRLVRLHEVGGDPRADLLKEADSLSYFEVNLPLYYAREGFDETLRRCVWGIKRLSPTGRASLRRMAFADRQIARIVQTAMGQVEE